MKMRLRRHGWKSATAIAATLALLAAFSGLAFAKAGTSSDQRPQAAGHDRKDPAKKHADAGHQRSERSDDDAGGGPPPGTHGYEVSKVAHATPPGPGHGRAVSKVARSSAGKQHPKHANHGHEHTGTNPDSDDEVS